MIWRKKENIENSALDRIERFYIYGFLKFSVAGFEISSQSEVTSPFSSVLFCCNGQENNNKYTGAFCWM